MYLLDTNVVSEFRRQRRADPAVLSWADREEASTFYVSVVTSMELEIGRLVIARRDLEQGRLIEKWLQDLMRRFAGRILPFDFEAARACASLHVPDRRPERDGIIAATALVHDMTIVTRNTRDFEPMGVRLLNPWLNAAR